MGEVIQDREGLFKGGREWKERGCDGVMRLMRVRSRVRCDFMEMKSQRGWLFMIDTESLKDFLGWMDFIVRLIVWWG